MATPPPGYEPPPWLKFIRKYIFVIAAVAGCITITAIRPFLRYEPDPPPVLFALPEYELVDHRGDAFEPETLRGKVWVAGFVFTSCPSSCPTITQAMSDLRDRYDRMGIDVEMVSFTVDPDHDTPQVLADYVADVGPNPKWRFVSGDPDAVKSLVATGFKLGLGERQQLEGGLYDIAHSTQLALIDGDGNVRGYYGIEPDQGLDEIFHRSQHVIKEAKQGD